MPLSRLLPAAALLLAMCALSTAQPPGAAPDTSAPLLSRLLPYLGDENFQKELKLTEAQVKRLLALRQKVWDEIHTTAPKDLKAEEQNKSIAAALKASLDAGQLERASQLATRTAWSSRGFASGKREGAPRTVTASTLAAHGEIAAALRLDETQATLVEVSGKGSGKKKGVWGTDGESGFFDRSTTIYLTPEQTAAAKALLGEAPAGGGFTPQRDVRTTGAIGTSPVTLLGYLLAPDVQKDLKMSAEQIKAASEQKASTTKGKGKRPRATEDESSADAVSPAERNKANAARLAEARAALAKILDAGQLKRLEQIYRREYMWSAEFEAGSELGKAIGVTDEQRKAYAAAQAARTAAVVKAVGSGEALEKVKAAAAEAGKACDAAIAKILTADQVAKKDDWLGKPFRGTTSVPPPLPAFQQAIFGRYADELTAVTRYPRVREELKLTEEQLGKAREASAALAEKFPALSPLQTKREKTKAVSPEERDKLYSGRSAFIEKALADILTKEQQARFRELLIQHAEAPRRDTGKGFFGKGGSPAGFTTRVSAASVPGVAEAIKLTAEQKKQIFDGAPAATVLTDAQKAAIKKMMGKEADVAVVFATPTTPDGRPAALAAMQKLMFGRHSAELTPLTRYPKVQEELKLTEDQLAKLREAFTALAEKFPAPIAILGSGVDVQEREKRFASRSAFVEKAIADILTKEQRARFRELQIQWRESMAQGKGGKTGKGAGNLFNNSGATSVPGVAEEIKLTAEQRNRILDGTKAADVLTDAQKAAIKKMMGKEVDIAVVFAARGVPDRPAPAPRVAAIPRVVTLARTLRYWDEVKLTPAQAGSLARAFNSYTLAAYQTSTAAERAAAIKAVTEAVEATLTVAQAKRLEQLALQAEAADSLVSALLGAARTPSAAKKELGITAEQEKAISAAAEELGAIASLLIQARGSDADTRKAVATQQMKLREKLDARIEGVLTAEQKQKWKDLIGEPHAGFTKSPVSDFRRRGRFEP